MLRGQDFGIEYSSCRRAPGNIACEDGVRLDILYWLEFEAGNQRQA